MLTWLVINIALSLLAPGFIRLNATAPHRLRFFAGFAALAAWLVPWPLLPDLLPVNMLSSELWRIERAVETGTTRLTAVIPMIVETRVVPMAREVIVLTVMELAFIALTFFGCVLFTWKLIAHRLLLRRLQRESIDGNWLWARADLAPVCPVGVQREIAGAFSSGLLKPCIWVHADLVHSPQLATLLRHEATHIHQYDNWYLLVITLVERLFWWNPFVWYLGRRTRELQELSCDERCQRANADYPAQLAQLMLDSARSACGPTTAQKPQMLALGANIFNNPHPNVKRIQLLQRSYPMLKRHILGAALTAASAFLAVGCVTAQPDEVEAVAAERMPIFQLKFPFGNEDGGVPAGAVQSGGVMRVARREDGARTISMSFTDAPLPNVLTWLLDFSGVPVTLAGAAVVRALDEDADTTHELSTAELMEAVEAAGGAVNWEKEMRVVNFRPRFVANDQLVLEYPGAANRLVSVTLTNLTLDQALDLVAEKSGCNIFQDGDRIVVDYCDE
jgi:beta-lactamase regulating signal transducer with metallopeptidase domain